MAWCGHPIAGDSLYGAQDDHEYASGLGARLFLECHRIELESPDGGREIFELAKCP
jgi:23S rRNA-/tRNA-specific pseudouridylate synthase